MPTTIDVRTEIMKLGLGTRTFEWLLDDEQAVRDAYGCDRHLPYLLSHYLVAEGQELHVLEILKDFLTSMPSTFDNEKRRRNRLKHSWIGRLVESMIAVHLARDVDGNKADAALRIPLWLADIQNQYGPTRCIHSAASHPLLGQHSRRANFSKTCPALFDRFIDRLMASQTGSRYGLAKESPRILLFHRALMLMKHPLRPDPLPLLQYYRKLGDVATRRAFSTKDASQAEWMWPMVTELSTLLRAQNRSDDAAWIDEMASTLEERQ